MRTRKLLCMLLVVIMVIAAMTACTSQPAVTTDAATTETTSGTPAETESKGEIIELRWLSAQIGEHAEAEWFASVVDGFNKEYEGRIKINVDGVAGEAINDKLKTDAASDTMPDLFMLNADAARFNLIADSGRAVDLMPYMEANPDLWEIINKDSAVAYTDKDGKLLGLPYAKSYTGIYYNKALFDAAGVSEFPATWDEFFVACDKLKASGVAPIALMTGENSWTTMLVMSHLLGTSEGGAAWLQSDAETVNFNDPAFIDASGKIQKMLAEYTTSDAIGATYAVAANNFLNGKAAMIANGPWMIGDFYNPETAMEGLSDNVVYWIAPGSGVNQSENIAYGIGSKEPAKIEAAFEVLKYLARQEVYAGFLNVSGNSPAMEIDASLLELDPILVEFLLQAMVAPNGYDQMGNCVKAACIDGLGQLLPDLATGMLTPEEFAEKLQEISDNN